MEEKKSFNVLGWFKEHKKAIAGTMLAGAGMAGAYYLGKRIGIEIKVSKYLDEPDFTGEIFNPIDDTIATYGIWTDYNLAMVRGVNADTCEYVAGHMKDVMSTITDVSGTGNLLIHFM